VRGNDANASFQRTAETEWIAERLVQSVVSYIYRMLVADVNE
jgi:hypothetical protein